MEEDFDVDMWTETIAPRYTCETGECSVQSCLNQFTACELMTGNNKVGCELCTKRHGGSDKKTAYTIAKKQLLIYNPPAVLILHLKRFQVIKINSHFACTDNKKHYSESHHVVSTKHMQALQNLYMAHCNAPQYSKHSI